MQGASPETGLSQVGAEYASSPGQLIGNTDILCVQPYYLKQAWFVGLTVLYVASLVPNHSHSRLASWPSCTTIPDSSPAQCAHNGLFKVTLGGFLLD